MRHFILFLLFILNCSYIFAVQPVGEPEWIIGDAENHYMHPVWSPDGLKIAFTGSNYIGLWVMNPDGSDQVKLTDEIAAGWGFEWSADSRSILTRVAKYEGPRRYNAVKIFDITNGNSIQVTDYKTFMPGLPHWADSDRQIILFNKKQLETFQSEKNISHYSAKMVKNKICFLRYGKIAIMDNSTKDISVIDPIKDSEYLNPVISPNYQKIAFEVYGGNLFVMDIDGSDLKDLGSGNVPQWSPESNHIVYMRTKDDGHRFTSSEIITADIETLEKTNITNTTDKLEMNPHWSPDGTKIAFNESNSGMIYIVEVNN